MDCPFCSPDAGQAALQRVVVWEDALWRVSARLESPIPGLSVLEPKRHIPYITDLDGEEAASLGPTLAKVCRALKSATGAGKIYLYVIGEQVAHCHFNLAPRHPGDPLQGGAGIFREDASPFPESALRATAALVGNLLNAA